MLIVGGSGNSKGAVLGAFVVWGIWTGTDWIINHSPGGFETRIFYLRNLLIGLLIVVVLLIRPRGILGEEKRVSLFFGKEPPKEQLEKDSAAPT
jgi:branched-chain amino acid transport system permease protein